MNKLFTKIAGLTLGFAMAIGVGVAVAGKQEIKETVKAAGTDATTYSLINSADDLEAGKSYIITNGTSGTVQAMSTESNNNNRRATGVTVSNGLITRGSSVLSLTLGGSTGAWTFATENYAGTDGYLASAASGNNNYLRVISNAGTATIAFSGDKAVINIGPHSTRKIIRYNTSGLFACYSSGQNDIYLWKEAGAATSFTVSYDANGATSGTVPVDENAYESGEKATVLGNTGNLARDGYTFMGWTYNNQTYQAGDEIVVESAVTLSAKWYQNDSISVVSGKESNEIYTGVSLILSTCVNAVGDGALSFTVPENDYYTYDAENLTLTADAAKTGGPATITAHKGSASTQFTVTVIERPASGVFEKFEGNIEEGDFLLTYDNGAMKAQISSDRFTYDTVAPSNDCVTNPDPLAVWHLAQSGDYWTLYNEETGKYAGSNAKNKGALVSTVGDNSKWTVTGTSTYEFENLGRSNGTDPGNKWLRRNTTNGFACYASGTGGALTLYKLASDVTKYEVIDRVDDGSLDKTQVVEGATLTATITPDEGYGLPESVDVMMAGSPVQFTYENGVVTVQNVQGNITIEGACVKINPIQYLYSKSGGASVDVYGYYVGLMDGTGPVIMDGEYGMVIYDKTIDVSGYTEGETILHVTGSISIYKGLYEIASPTVAVASGTYDAPAQPVVYATSGGETAEYASRLTTVTGVATLVSGNFDDEAGTGDITMSFAVSSNTIQVFYKKAAQTADAEAFAAIKAAVANQTEITVKGFTGWYNGFQVQMNGVIKAIETYTADDFAEDLLAQTDAICVNFVDGESSYSEFKELLTAVWSNLAGNDKYPALPSDQKAILADAERVEDGTTVERAMARYDYLTGKYELSNFINGRTPMANFRGNLLTEDSNDVAILIVVIAIASISTFGCLLLLKKKRKHQ